ncbi:MAG: LacI family DNA-binding transcriptional regulator [Leifsonia sp.]
MSAEQTSKRKVTRADVADRAGVSTAVVSYVMTGAKHVSPDTEARVRLAIAELGYRPNTTARALKTGRTELLGVVIPDVSNPYYAEFALEMEVVAAELGHALIIANSHGDPRAEVKIVENLRTRAVDGLIVASVFHAGSRADKHPGDAPILWVDSFDDEPGTASIGLDAFEGSRVAVEHLIRAHGRRRIAVALGRSNREADDPRLLGWAAALREAGLPPGPVAHIQWNREGGVAAARQLLDGPDRPDAVFTASDLIAFGLLRTAEDLGVRIPTDLAVVSYDGTREAAYSSPRLTTLRQPMREMARAAVETIIGYEPGRAGRRAFRGELVLSESCGCEPLPGFQTSTIPTTPTSRKDPE